MGSQDFEFVITCGMPRIARRPHLGSRSMSSGSLQGVIEVEESLPFGRDDMEKLPMTLTESALPPSKEHKFMEPHEPVEKNLMEKFNKEVGLLEEEPKTDLETLQDLKYGFAFCVVDVVTSPSPSLEVSHDFS